MGVVAVVAGPAIPVVVGDRPAGVHRPESYQKNPARPHLGCFEKLRDSSQIVRALPVLQVAPLSKCLPFADPSIGLRLEVHRPVPISGY